LSRKLDVDFLVDDFSAGSFPDALYVGKAISAYFDYMTSKIRVTCTAEIDGRARPARKSF
jgi:hypothetical protein